MFLFFSPSSEINDESLNQFLNEKKKEKKRKKDNYKRIYFPYS